MRRFLGGRSGRLTTLALFASHAAVTVALSFLLGFSSFFTAPALNARMFDVAGAAPTLAGATTTAAFNLGNTGGPWLGGVVIDADLGFASRLHRVGGRRDDGRRHRTGRGGDAAARRVPGGDEVRRGRARLGTEHVPPARPGSA